MSKLDTLIEQFGNHNADFNSLKKICDSEKSQIKEIMDTEGIKEQTSGGWKVNYIVSERETMNEDLMLSILQNDWVTRYGSIPCPYIKTKEYVDMDALEAVLYAGEIPNETLLELDKCRTVTTVTSLRCTKAKKSKGDE